VPPGSWEEVSEAASSTGSLSWVHVPAAEVSVLAQKRRGELREWRTSVEGYTVGLLERGGDVPAPWMLDHAQSAATSAAWALRGLGALAIFIGYLLLLGPANHIASYVPLLGSLVGCALSMAALAVAFAHTLVAIAVAWLSARRRCGLAAFTSTARPTSRTPPSLLSGHRWPSPCSPPPLPRSGRRALAPRARASASESSLPPGARQLRAGLLSRAKNALQRVAAHTNAAVQRPLLS
jgi:gamma-tubulin complex component 4